MNNIVDLACQLEETCRFCYPPEKERILYATENFYVMASLGPIVEGYLLIVSKKHIPACANIPNEIFQEYLDLKEKVKGVLNKVYGACIFYEHGKTGSYVIGKDHRHCFHAHLHCIPVEVCIFCMSVMTSIIATVIINRVVKFKKKILNLFYK